MSASAIIRGRTLGSFARQVSVDRTFSLRNKTISYQLPPDINEKALTFINRESYLKRNYLTNVTGNAEKEQLRRIFHDNILINIRTYDSHSLVLYVNDHYNNFVHLYITNSNEVVCLYNYGDEIVNLTIVDAELSSGKSIQVAIVRSDSDTTMHVNAQNVTVERGVRLLEEYSNRPWVNPERGTFSCGIFFMCVCVLLLFLSLDSLSCAVHT